MRKVLAVWMSALWMIGAAEAATIDGLDSVIAGSPTEFTFTYEPFKIDDRLISYTSSVYVNKVPYLPEQTGLIDALKGGALKITKTFQPEETLLTLEVVLHVVAWGTWKISNTEGNCSGLVPGSCTPVLADSNSKWNSELSFVFKQPVTFQGAALTRQSLSSAEEVSVVPIAGALPLLLTGLGILGWFARRRGFATA